MIMVRMVRTVVLTVRTAEMARVVARVRSWVRPQMVLLVFFAGLLLLWSAMSRLFMFELH